MAETKLSEIVRQEVEDMTALVDAYLKEMWAEIWPSIVDLKPPKERADWYRSIDWQALKDTSEDAWLLLSADALRLTAKEDQRIRGAQEAYADEATRERSALRSEMEPLGGVQAVAGAQLNMPLPLGRRTA